MGSRPATKRLRPGTKAYQIRSRSCRVAVADDSSPSPLPRSSCPPSTSDASSPPQRSTTSPTPSRTDTGSRLAATYTGPRYGELAALRTDDLDLPKDASVY